MDLDALRVDVINPRIAPALLTRDFHRAHPGIELDVVTHLFDADAAIAAVGSGVIDASFRAVTKTAQQLPAGVEVARVLDDPLQLLTGPAHKLATARAVTPGELAGHRRTFGATRAIWMPAAVPDTEWAAFYDELAAAFGLTIDTVGPNFGTDDLLEVIADSPALATFVSERRNGRSAQHHRVSPCRGSAAAVQCFAPICLLSSGRPLGTGQAG